MRILLKTILFQAMNNVEKAVLYYLGKDGINTTSLAVEHLSSLFPHAFKDYKSAFSHAFLNLYNKHYLVREKTKKNGPSSMLCQKAESRSSSTWSSIAAKTHIFVRVRSGQSSLSTKTTRRSHLTQRPSKR